MGESDREEMIGEFYDCVSYKDGFVLVNTTNVLAWFEKWIVKIDWEEVRGRMIE